MATDSDELPEDLWTELLRFIRETEDGQWEVVDKRGLIQFVAQHGEQYPVLCTLFTVNAEAAGEYYERTGEVPLGIKLVRKTRESEKVTRLEVLRGKNRPKSE